MKLKNQVRLNTLTSTRWFYSCHRQWHRMQSSFFAVTFVSQIVPDWCLWIPGNHIPPLRAPWKVCRNNRGSANHWYGPPISMRTLLWFLKPKYFIQHFIRTFVNGWGIGFEVINFISMVLPALSCWYRGPQEFWVFLHFWLIPDPLSWAFSFDCSPVFYGEEVRLWLCLYYCTLLVYNRWQYLITTISSKSVRLSHQDMTAIWHKCRRFVISFN